jgi:hypothetical protein
LHTHILKKQFAEMGEEHSNLFSNIVLPVLEVLFVMLELQYLVDIVVRG